MQGQNTRRPAEHAATCALQVHEIFRTIQGEGPFSGMPAVFVRLTGCNLACTFCDTNWDDANDKYVSVVDVANEIECIAKFGDLIVITGGEPMRQDLFALCSILMRDGWKMQIETAGTYWQPKLLPLMTMGALTFVCSPKTKAVHPEMFKHCRHWKYVIQSGRVNIYDGLPAEHTQFVSIEDVKNYVAPDIFNEANAAPGKLLHTVTGSAKYGNPARPPQFEDTTVWLSPCDELGAKNRMLNAQACVESAMKFGYRVNLQIHKILGLR